MARTLLIPLLVALACGGRAGVPATPSQDPEPTETPQGSDETFVVDLRPPEDFARRHLKGSVNLQWGWGQFELRVGRLFPRGARLKIVGADEDRIAQAVKVARERGYRPEGRVVEFAELPPEQVTGLSGLTARELHRRRGEFLILDARTAKEYASGHVRTALFLYPDDIRAIAPGLRKDHPVAVICEGGWRSSLVASWLRREGFETVYNVPGGMAEWRGEDLPIESAEDQKGFR